MRVRRFALLAALTIVATACGQVAEPAKPPPAADGWHEFAGSWSAAGKRRNLPLGAERQTAIVELRGTLLLHGHGRPGVGFHADLIGLGDSAKGLVGRSVWTDERGDQLFSEVTGEGTQTRNRITGTFVGGSGRYAGASGDYAFSWQNVMEQNDGSVQGRAADLKGRVRVGAGAGAGGAPK